MTTINKLNRALESLKKVIAKPSEFNKQKEKVSLCLTITDLVCKSNEKNALLTFTVSSLIQLLEDADSNTRLIIDESLNKIIRASMDNSNYVAKILIALLKVLGKNTNEKCLKAALWRFSELAHFIRPQKGKIYVKTLVPIVAKIAARKDESIVETLAESLPNIFKHIGLFSSDNDVKGLLKTFLKNLYSDMPEIRRAAAFSIIAVCKYSRQPEYFFLYTLTTVLGLLCECQKSEQECRNLIQGCLSCIRNILPYVSASDDSSNNCEHHLQIYELCLQYAKFHDHNVVTAALETLNELLQGSSATLVRKLTAKGGLATSTVLRQENHGSTLSLDGDSDEMSIGSTIARTDDGVFSETRLSKRLPLFSSSSGSCTDLNNEQKQIRTEKWIQEYPDKETESISSSLLNINTSHFANSDDEEEKNKEIDSSLVSSFRAMSVDNIQQLNDNDAIPIGDRRRQNFKSEKSVNISFMSNATSINTLSIDLDIGDVIDETDIPLHYCARFLVSAFLVDNQNSKKVRVSVLSLTFNCLSHVLRIHPQVAEISLEKNGSVYEGYHNLLQVMLSYSSHEDQQVRGLVCVVIGNFIVSSLIEDNYLPKQSNHLNESLLAVLTNHLSKGLRDESSVCVKNTVYAVSLCIHPLMLCPKFKLSVALIEAIFALVDNPYWLIKVKILEIIGDLCFETLYYVNENSTLYQDRALRNVIIALLGDVDGRVRSAAASCLIRFAKSAYYPIDRKYEPCCVTWAKKLNTELAIPLMKNLDDGMEDPLEHSLSRILHRLKRILEDPASKHIMAGCVEALSLLAHHYSPVEYSRSWQCCYLEGIHPHPSYSPCQLFDTAISLSTNSTLLLNFDVHPQLLKLSSKLFSALCASNLKTKKFVEIEIVDNKWSFLTDPKLKDAAESYLAHLIRMCHVFDDVVTGVTLKSPTPLNTSSQILWPLRIDEPALPKQEAFTMCTQTNTKSKSFFKLEEKNVPIVQYSRFPLYVKLSELLKSAYNNYKVTLKPESSEKFVNFMKTVIDCLAETLNYTTIGETDRITKELLAFLHNFMVFIPIASVKCVSQLLRSLFGINKVAESLHTTEYDGGTRTMSISYRSEGFYDSCFQSAYDKVANFVSHHSDNSGSVELLKGWTSQTCSPVKQFKRKITVNMLPSYIKFFEPSVIQSLKQYTVSGDTELQAEVLVLLSELIQLKVNYCLLDSEQVFIKFVLSQFQLIEEGQLLNVENLLPQMFNFLINLANEKHSKPVMSVPKVIQLCDSLIASGQAISHCVIAIEPLVQHVFWKYSVIANSSEIKELETQQDVLFTMLLRLLPHPESLDLIASVLADCEDDVKLKRSCQVVEIFFNALMDCKIVVEDDKSYKNVVNLLFALHRSSFTEQHILNVLFNVYNTYKTNDFGLWLPSVTAVLLYIVTTYKETTLLVAVEQMLSHPVFLDTDYDADPLFISVAKNAPVIPEKAFVRLLCEIIYKVVQRISNTKMLTNAQNKNKLWKYKLLSEFVLVISYVIKSGRYEIIKTELSRSEYPNEDGKKFIFEVTDLSSCLLVTHPIVTLRLYELLMVLKSDDISLSCYFSQSNFEFDIFGMEISLFSDKLEGRSCLSLATVKLGIFLLTCLRKDEILDNAETLKAFLEFNFNECLISIEEPPVYELRFDMQSSPVASNVFLQIIRNMLPLICNENKWLKNTLQYLGEMHENTKGQVLLLCCQPQILNNSSFLISNRAYELAIEIIEYLSSIRERQKFEAQLAEQDIHSLVEQVKNSSCFSQPLMSRIAEMVSPWYQIQFPLNDNRPLSFDRLHSLVADKQWFFTQVKHKCCSNEDSLNFVMARLLAYLPFDEIVSIMRSENFNIKIIPSCFTIGAELSVQNAKLKDGQPPESCSDLFLASRLTVFRHLEHLGSLLPRTHQVYGPIKRESSKKETQYGQRMDILFSDKELTETISCLAAALDRYLSCVEKYEISVDSDDSYKLMSDFSVLCLELVHWMIKNHRRWSKTTVQSILKYSITILKIKAVSELLSSTRLGSIICCIYALTESYQNETINESFSAVLNELKNTENWDTIYSSHLTSILIDYFINEISRFDQDKSVGLSMLGLIRQLLVILSQCASFYNYLRIPLEVWKHVTLDDVSVGSCITLNNLPENFLQDKEILQNFVSRLTLLGWNNRLQFEECWMSLLIALNSLPEYESSEEDVLALSQINSMAVNAITSLLVQTMYHPIPGNKIFPKVFHLSRNKYLDDVRCKWRRKLSAVNEILSPKINQENQCLHILHSSTNVNIERLHNENKYSCNQISMEYLTFNCTNSFTSEEDVPVSFHFQRLRTQYSERVSIMKSFGIDTNSCIYFLIEFYSRWLAKPDNQSVDVLIEILNSMLTISDLFTELSQFSWLLESGVVMWKKYSKDNDVICAYLTVIICKSSSIATPRDNDSQKLIIKILNSGLNSNKKIVQQAALHGLLYLLESIFKKDVLEKNEIITADYKDGILSAAILFVLENLDVELVEKFNDEIANCVISIAFYLIENVACGDNVDIIIDRLCKLSVRGCKLKKLGIHTTVVQGFYNLILYENESIKANDSLMQFLKETFSLLDYSTSVAVLNLQLLLALMYSSGDFEDTRNSEASSDVPFDTEKLISRMEKLSIFFERIKKGSKQEASIICAILPKIILDFFSTSEILNKVILEFLFPNHPHTELMAEVVFQVFQNAILQSQLFLIQDWVLSLLNNFAKYPLPTAIYYLNCFFISASTNPWLRALFPLITRRNGCLEYEDRKIVCISAKQFYSQLSDGTQKTIFLSTFQAAEKIHPESPFSNIVKTIL